MLLLQNSSFDQFLFNCFIKKIKSSELPITAFLRYYVAPSKSFVWSIFIQLLYQKKNPVNCQLPRFYIPFWLSQIVVWLSGYGNLVAISL